MDYNINGLNRQQLQGGYPTIKLDKSNLLYLFLSIIALDKKQYYIDNVTFGELSLVSKKAKIICDVTLSDVIYTSLSVYEAASLLLTLPNLKAASKIPLPFHKEMPQTLDRVIFVYQNNGYLTEMKFWKDPFQYVEYLRAEKTVLFEKFEKMAFTECLSVIDTFLEDVKKVLPIDKMTQSQKTAFLTTRKICDFNCSPRLNSVIMNGERLSLTKAKVRLFEIQESSFYVRFSYQGEYLYRSVREDEWTSIQNDGQMLIRDRDNFEEEVGQQVKYYKDQPGYAGLIIRIPNKTPYNSRAGFAVRRISTILPHFMDGNEIFVSKTGDESSFVPLKNYLKED